MITASTSSRSYSSSLFRQREGFLPVSFSINADPSSRRRLQMSETATISKFNSVACLHERRNQVVPRPIGEPHDADTNAVVGAADSCLRGGGVCQGQAGSAGTRDPDEFPSRAVRSGHREPPVPLLRILMLRIQTRSPWSCRRMCPFCGLPKRSMPLNLLLSTAA